MYFVAFCLVYLMALVFVAGCLGCDSVIALCLVTCLNCCFVGVDYSGLYCFGLRDML